MRNKILVTPSGALKNDLHLKLLYNVLQKNGFTVFPFSLRNLFIYRKKAIWHIHWIDVFHRGTYHNKGIYKPNPIISFLRLIVFLYLLLMVKMLRVKVIWSIHNVCSHEFGETIFEKIVTVCLLRFSNRVIALNEYIRQAIKTKFKYDNIMLMRQGIYEGCYPDTVQKVNARDKLGIPHNKFVLLLFGALLPYKGVDILIEALSNYNDDNIFVILAGRTNENPEYGQLIKKIAKNDKRIKVFDKYIAEKEIPNFFGAADYTICPYKRISNSGILFLSYTFGVPSIISDKGGVREVTDLVPETSILIKEPTTKNIIEAIREAKRRPDVSDKMAKMQEMLSWRRLENSILEVFNL